MYTTAASLNLTFLTRLRTETRDEHEAIEETLKLMHDDLTLVAYRHQLEQLYGFYKPVEGRIFGIDSVLAGWMDLQKRHKMTFLEADLNELGGHPFQQLPICVDLPPLDNAAGCFGCMYVLEGATLGGTVISRYIQEKLGVTPSAGGRFFSGYGKQTGAMWHEFRAAITKFSSATDQHDVIISSARTTFKALQHWCQRK